MRRLMVCLALLVGIALIAAPALAQQNTEEADGCADCHSPRGAHMHWVVDTWYDSRNKGPDNWSSRKSNSYCAKCHSPFEGDPYATRQNRADVPQADWQAITCGSCHPPHDLRVMWDTPIGNYVVGEPREVPNPDYDPDDDDSDEYIPNEDAWIPRYEGRGGNDLCAYCHNGSGHADLKEFQGYGKAMERQGVNCWDCHMPKVPNDAVDRLLRTHEFPPPEVLFMPVEEGGMLMYSCGTYEGGCHSNKTELWALKQIQKEKIHTKEKSNQGGGNDED